MKASTERREAGVRRVDSPAKSDLAFRTIGEVAEELGVAAHVLRFWETKFPQIKPVKRGGGRRYYRPDDVALLRGVRRMLHVERYSIKGAQKLLNEQGVAAAMALGAEPEGRRARMRVAEAHPVEGFGEPEAFGLDPVAGDSAPEDSGAALFEDDFDLDSASLGGVVPQGPAPEPAPASAFRPSSASPEAREIERASAELRARLEAALKAAEEARELLARLEARRRDV
ncbi:MerR family transcriptional regulator [Neomegalonema sp.]|uniref:MerR family transcriptional regulator n=1 Tax=Neomegalonema sp. TaxID=2039713 RepID=UPI00262719A0|nr:MerR family transcriptional regulator [Neomegalonema sp.]MDD2869579.1 MerR family transcriptional regulator [Neomegalonema sp.]